MLFLHFVVPHPLSLPLTPYGHPRVSKELHFFIESFPFPRIIKANENLIPFSKVLYTSILMSSDSSPMDGLLRLVLTTLLVLQQGLNPFNMSHEV